MIGHLECCCCGGDAGHFKQWWNIDTGYGICLTCVADARQRGESEAEIKSSYGVEGVHYAARVTKDEAVDYAIRSISAETKASTDRVLEACDKLEDLGHERPASEG
jgi:hypothetical protein